MKRVVPGGMVFHVLNRGVGWMKIFSTERDDLAFEETVDETLRFYPMRILAYCWLPYHSHYVLWLEDDGQLSALLQRVTATVVRVPCSSRLRVQRSIGHGHANT